MTEIESGREHSLDEATMRRLYPSLRRLAAVVAPSEVGPDDLLQEAFERFFTHTATDVIHPEAYLRRIIVNAASNHRRRLSRWRVHRQRLIPRPGDGAAVDDYPSDVSFLELISPVERAVLFLHHVEGVSLREIGRQLDLTEAATKQIAVRARRRLRSHLTQEATT